MPQWISHAQWGSTHGTSGNAYWIGQGSDYYVCHHTPDQDGLGQWDQAVAEAQSVERGHVRNGWGGVGYTYMVSGDYIFEGRTFGYSGAHAPGANSNSVGVAFLLDGRNRQPTDTEWNSAAAIAQRGVDEGWLVSGFTTTGHRFWVATECPAAFVQGNLNKLRQAMAGGITPTPVPKTYKKTVTTRSLEI
jgi:N-acetylmuramoyl-L-alanine amidase